MAFGRSTREARSHGGEITGFFAQGVEIQGEIRFKETLRVDGRIRGTVRGDGELVVGATGEVEGEIAVAVLSVSGRIKGTLRVKERLEVHEGGRVEGDVLLGRPGLVVHDGGVMEAKVQMGTVKDQPVGAAAPARPPEGRATTVNQEFRSRP